VRQLNRFARVAEMADAPTLLVSASQVIAPDSATRGRLLNRGSEDNTTRRSWFKSRTSPACSSFFLRGPSIIVVHRESNLCL